MAINFNPVQREKGEESLLKVTDIFSAESFQLSVASQTQLAKEKREIGKMRNWPSRDAHADQRGSLWFRRREKIEMIEFGRVRGAYKKKQNCSFSETFAIFFCTRGGGGKKRDLRVIKQVIKSSYSYFYRFAWAYKVVVLTCWRHPM